MADFFWGSGGQKITPEQVERRRALAQQLAQQGTNTGPVGSAAEGWGRVAAALAGAAINLRNDSQENSAREGAQQRFQNVLMASQPGAEYQGPVQPGESMPAVEKPRFADIAAAMSDPWLGRGQQAIGSAMIQNALRTNDPQKLMEVNGGVFDPNTRTFVVDPMKKAPTTRDVIRGDLKVTEEFQPDGTWKEIGSGRAFAPVQPQQAPAEIQAYNLAQQQGFKGSILDFMQARRPGMSIQTNPDGTFSITQGNVPGGKPLTEQQSKDTVFATRAEGALAKLNPIANELTDFAQTQAERLPLGAGKYLQSESFQKAGQAGQEFLQAMLRKDTGAAITPQETSEYGTVYLPMPGDKPGVLAQKEQSRLRALEAMKAGMPPAAILAQELALRRSGSQTMAPATQSPATRPPPAGVSAEDWQYMTEQERALFK